MLCLLPAYRVCDQAFGRYRPLKGAKSGHLTITKIENLHTDTHRKIYDSKNAILFNLQRKITKNCRRIPVSDQWRHQALVNAWPS